MNRKSWIKFECISFLIILAIGHLPLIFYDVDQYWLASTGRYIIEHHQIPTENYWSVATGMHTVIQQWLCCVVNYGLTFAGTYVGRYIFSIITFLVLICCYYKYAKFQLKDTTLTYVLLVIAGFLFVIFNSTRPYMITILIQLLVNMLLFWYFRCTRHGIKQSAVFLSGMIILGIVQSNWQAASLVFLYAWVIPYMLPYLNLYSKKWAWYPCKAWMGFLGCCATFLGSICNPNGLNNSLYFINTFGYTKAYVSREMQKPSILSFTCILVFIELFILLRFIKQFPAHTFYLTVGCCALAVMAYRNLWCLALPIPFLCKPFARYCTSFLEKLKPKVSFRQIIGHCCILLLFLCALWITPQVKPTTTEFVSEEVLAEMQSNTNTKLFTDQFTGGWFEEQGLQVYADSRIEVYGKNIAGDNAIMDEFSDMMYGRIDYDKFFQKYGFNYFATTNVEHPGIYLSQHPEKYQCIYQNDTVSVYKLL